MATLHYSYPYKTYRWRVSEGLRCTCSQWRWRGPHRFRARNVRRRETVNRRMACWGGGSKRYRGRSNRWCRCPALRMCWRPRHFNMNWMNLKTAMRQLLLLLLFGHLYLIKLFNMLHNTCKQSTYIYIIFFFL